MSTPGFSAESGLYRSYERYKGRADHSTKRFAASGSVQPQFWRIPAAIYFAKKAFYAGCYYGCLAGDNGDIVSCGDSCPGGGL